ncbi:MAG TPA: hypothetical protein VGB50_06405 [Flavobacterium sp.]|jgi:hypothetical protein
MNKIFYLLFLCVSIGYAQNTAPEGAQKLITEPAGATAAGDKLLKKEDFKAREGRMLVDSRSCRITNYDTTSTVLVSVVCQQKAFNQLGVEKINEMIRLANDKVRNTVQAQHQYKPTEIRMAYLPDSNDWSLTSAYTVLDENGHAKKNLLSLDFDANGDFAVMKRIF